MSICFKDNKEHLEETGRMYSEEWVHTFAEDGSKTCLLEDGHEGDHEFVNDSEIVIRLSD